MIHIAVGEQKSGLVCEVYSRKLIYHQYSIHLYNKLCELPLPTKSFNTKIRIIIQTKLLCRKQNGLCSAGNLSF